MARLIGKLLEQAARAIAGASVKTKRAFPPSNWTVLGYSCSISCQPARFHAYASGLRLAAASRGFRRGGDTFVRISSAAAAQGAISAS
jgi:hypothetical protein